jgi:hypothetical protein
VTRQQIPDNIDVSLSLSRVSISVEKKAYRHVRVIPRLAGNPRRGYFTGNPKILPEFVTVSGPESFVQAIDSVQTKTISIENESIKVAREVALEKPPGLNVAVEPGEVNVYVPVYEIENLQEHEVKIEARGGRGDFEYALGGREARVYIRSLKDDLHSADGDLEVYVDLATLNLDQLLRIGREDAVERELPVIVLIKNNRDAFKAVHVIPDRIQVRVTRKK